jgi:hypothetical protein
MAQRFAGPLSRYGLALSMLCGFVLPAWGGADGADSRSTVDGLGAASVSAVTGDLFDFDIPAQPLDAALYLFGDTSRQPALFPSAMIAGLASSAVHGRYAAETALRLLLGGTGLAAEKVESTHGDIFLLKRVEGGGSNMAGVPAAGSGLDGYPALVQARVMQALCANARIAPGSFRSLFRVQVGAAGQMVDARLIDSTGDNRRDAALLATLLQVQMGAPPPSAAMQQPFTMALLPLHPGAASPCGAQARGQQP